MAGLEVREWSKLEDFICELIKILSTDQLKTLLQRYLHNDRFREAVFRELEVRND